MKKSTIGILVVLLSWIMSSIVHAQNDPYPLVEKALTLHALHQLESAANERRLSLHEEADRALGPNALLSDEFFRQAAIYTARHGDEVIPPGVTREEMVAHARVLYLMRLFDLLGDERGAPALINLLYADSNYSIDSFYLLAELAPNDPAIDERIARGIELVLAGPPYPYRGIQPKMLHYQRADLAIENAQKLSDFADNELERIGTPTIANQDDRIALHGLQSLSRSVIAFAERYGWSDTAPPETVVERVVEGRLVDDSKRVVHPEAQQRVYQAMRRRGLVDMFTERALEEIMAEELGSDKTYRLSSILETLRADIDDELRQKIDESNTERGRRIRERIRREQEAATDTQ